MSGVRLYALHSGPGQYPYELADNLLLDANYPVKRATIGYKALWIHARYHRFNLWAELTIEFLRGNFNAAIQLLLTFRVESCLSESD